MKKALSAALLAILVACEQEPKAPEVCGPVEDESLFIGDSRTVTTCFNDESVGTLVYAATSSNVSVVTATSVGNAVDLHGLTVGEAVVTVTATDGDGLSANVNFRVTVPNRVPEPCYRLRDVELFVGDTVSVPFCFMDLDGHAMTFTASASTPGIEVETIDTLVVLRGVATENVEVTLTATDEEGGEGSTMFMAVLPNRPPEVCGGLPASGIVYRDAQVSFAVCIEDPDNQMLTDSIETGGLLTAELSENRDALLLMGTGLGETYVRLWSTDPHGESAETRMDVTVGEEIILFQDEFDDTTGGWVPSPPYKPGSETIGWINIGNFEIENGILHATAQTPPGRINSGGEVWGGATKWVDAENWILQVRSRVREGGMFFLIEIFDANSTRSYWLLSEWGSATSRPFYKTGMLVVNHRAGNRLFEFVGKARTDGLGRIPNGAWVDLEISVQNGVLVVKTNGREWVRYEGDDVIRKIERIDLKVMYHGGNPNAAEYESIRLVGIGN